MLQVCIFMYRRVTLDISSTCQCNTPYHSVLQVCTFFSRCVTRDIGGTDPERMAAPRLAEYIQQAFAGSCINVRVEQDPAVFAKNYPLLEAVNRAAAGWWRFFCFY